MAQIHLEVYRRFQGRLRAHPFRFWPILTAGIRIGCKKKLPLLILYAPPVIGTIVFSFVVYAKFAAEEQLLSDDLEAGLTLQQGLQQGLQQMLANQAMKLLEVRNQIIQFNTQMSVFALLAVAWFGSGLLCEDRRVGAHQLYFARPLTRIDYFLGKFLTVGFFAALAMLVPGLVICLVASWSSPDWSFLKEEGDVVLRTIAYALIWITVAGSITLCSSALFPRRSFALAGIFGFSMILEALANILREVVDERFLAVAPLENLVLIAGEVMGQPTPIDIEPSTSWMVLISVTAAALLVTGWRIRRLEVVA